MQIFTDILMCLSTRVVEAEAVKYLWELKQFEERSWKRTRKRLTF